MSSTNPMTNVWIAIQIVYLIINGLICGSLSARLPDIYWNSSNPIFRIDNTDHIIDVNRGNVAYEYDQVNIVCPLYTKGTREDDIETYIIYNVSKEEYDTCRIANSATARTIAVCDKPHLNRYYTITFRPFTPQPGGLEFRPGQDYYFISLSATPSLGAGRCNSHHMKVVFKVCCKRGSVTPPSVRSTSTTTSSSTTTPKPVTPSGPSRVLRIWTLEPPVNISSNRAPPVLDSNSPKRSHKNWYQTSLSNSSSNVFSTSRPSLMAYNPLSSKAPTIQSSTAQTPYWWRPHFTKMPATKVLYDSSVHSDQGYPSKKKDNRDKRPNDTREKSDGLNSAGAIKSSPVRTIITVLITINLLLSWLRIDNKFDLVVN